MWSPSLHERRTVVDARDQDARGEDQDAAALGVQAVHAVHMGVDLVVTQGECLGWWRGQGEVKKRSKPWRRAQACDGGLHSPSEPLVDVP